MKYKDDLAFYWVENLSRDLAEAQFQVPGIQVPGMYYSRQKPVAPVEWFKKSAN